MGCIDAVMNCAVADERSIRGAGFCVLHPEKIYCSLKLHTFSAPGCRQQVNMCAILEVFRVSRPLGFERDSENILQFRS